MLRDYHFLYVEDDPMSREVVALAMKQMQVGSISIFEDSSDFMTRVCGLANVPHVVLLDIHMKPHSGFELLQMLRGNEKYNNTRIIALTASVMGEEVQRLLDAGFDGAIAKPLDIQHLPELMTKIIAGETIWHID